MNHQPLPFALTTLFVVVIFTLEGCARKATEETQTSKIEPAPTRKADIKLPPNFGVFYESADGPQDLGKKPMVAASTPSFLLYLEKPPAADKLRLRLVKASASGFVIDAGSITNSESAEPKTSPKPGNYQNVFVFAYREDAGVYDPQVTAVDQQASLFKATYSETLKPGEYFAFYFVDESKGDKPWVEARFKLAGQFTVK